jgi:putative sterol carrier protein
MGVELFSDTWAKAWCKKINGNESYRKAAANWEGAMVLEMTADAAFGVAAARAVVADLWHGACRKASAAGEEEMAQAPYVIRAAPVAWRDVLNGKVDPIFGLMRGKLKLAKGGLFSLLPYAVAAKELVVSARQVDTAFPSGWE